jgi:hypothetical protein
VSIRLESIAFNHDPNAVHADAINIRRNAFVFLPVPEWQRQFSFLPDDSVAAYAIQETLGNRITIRARLSRLDPRVDSAEVRALSVEEPLLAPGIPPWLLGAYPFLNTWEFVNSPFPYYLWQLANITAAGLPPPAGVLGDVKARQVTFAPGSESSEALFELENPRLWERGVGIHRFNWQWQYRLSPGGAWRNINRSRHKIYTLLALPASPQPYPWQQAPFHPSNTQLPWTEVMEYACDWAFGTHKPDEAAARITRAVFNLGGTFFRYACDVGGLTQYTDLLNPYFYCTEFLEHLRGGVGRGWLINCTDCSSVVSTFANILGCQLWQSRMYTLSRTSALPLTFALNPIRAIGSDFWQPACGWPGFGMHEVAWEGNCTENEEVYDACLEVDGGADPTRAPFTPLLPANLRFGRVGDGLYRDRLASPRDNGRELCEPHPETRQRRFVL